MGAKQCVVICQENGTDSHWIRSSEDKDVPVNRMKFKARGQRRESLYTKGVRQACKELSAHAVK